MSRFHLENEELMEAVKKREEQEALNKPTDKDRLRVLMDRLLGQTHPSQLLGLKELSDGMQRLMTDPHTGASLTIGTNDLSLRDFGEAFYDSLDRRLDPKTQLLGKVRDLLMKQMVIPHSEVEKALAALEVGLGL